MVGVHFSEGDRSAEGAFHDTLVHLLGGGRQGGEEWCSSLLM